MTDAILCQRCGQEITTFAEWFSEPCPLETPDAPGHRLTWLEVMKLEFQAHPERNEVK